MERVPLGKRGERVRERGHHYLQRRPMHAIPRLMPILLRMGLSRSSRLDVPPKKGIIVPGPRGMDVDDWGQLVVLLI